MTKSSTADATLEMPGWLDALGGFIDRTAGFWQKVGDLESSAHREQLDAIRIDRPFYVAGIARSGSTILLELLAGRPGVATHRYRDFPPIYTPLFWNRAFGQVYRGDAPPAERPHKDRILVTPDSPEAMEEVLWMRFFPTAHDTATSQVLDAATTTPPSSASTRDHLKKILLVRGGQRYLSKGNYNLTRFAYLLKLFPDARFVVPVRDPRWHIASLMKQHRLFDAEERATRASSSTCSGPAITSSASTGARSTSATPCRPLDRDAVAGGPGSARLGALLGDALRLRDRPAGARSGGPARRA